MSLYGLEKNIFNIYGESGRQWLMNLSELTTQMKITHGLSDLKSLKNLSYNYVLSGFQGALPVILKLCLDARALQLEAHALKAFSGFGAVAVLAHEAGMLLLECGNFDAIYYGCPHIFRASANINKHAIS